MITREYFLLHGTRLTINGFHFIGTWVVGRIVCVCVEEGKPAGRGGFIVLNLKGVVIFLLNIRGNMLSLLKF